ncbi:hypothetical protein GCM10009602_08900 [Nocardiopsis tropica]
MGGLFGGCSDGHAMCVQPMRDRYLCPCDWFTVGGSANARDQADSGEAEDGVFAETDELGVAVADPCCAAGEAKGLTRVTGGES